MTSDSITYLLNVNDQQDSNINDFSIACNCQNCLETNKIQKLFFFLLKLVLDVLVLYFSIYQLNKMHEYNDTLLSTKCSYNSTLCTSTLKELIVQYDVSFLANVIIIIPFSIIAIICDILTIFCKNQKLLIKLTVVSITASTLDLAGEFVLNITLWVSRASYSDNISKNMTNTLNKLIHITSTGFIISYILGIIPLTGILCVIYFYERNNFR